MEHEEWEDREMDMGHPNGCVCMICGTLNGPQIGRDTLEPMFFDAEEHTWRGDTDQVLLHRKYGPAWEICPCGHVHWDIATARDDAHNEMCSMVMRHSARCEHGTYYKECKVAADHWDIIDNHFKQNGK